VRYLRALWRDELPESAEQKRLLNLPGRDRVYSDVPAVPSGTLVYDKTGSTARLCGDMGILVVPRVAGPAVPYAVVGIIQRNTSVSSYGSWISARGDVIRGVSGLAYAYLKATKGLV
jgi:beta-lactamase class A